MAVRNNQSDGASIAFDNATGDIFTNTPFSAMAWANLYSGGSNPAGRAVLTVWDNPTSKSWAIRADTTGSLVFKGQTSFDGAASDEVLGATVLSLDAWNHLGVDFDGTDLTIWLNGILEATLNNPGTVFDDDEDFGIGGTGDGGNQMDVDTADVRYYDRILSAEEWLTIFTAQGHDGIVEGLSGRMPLNDREPGILVTAKNPIDAGPLQIPFASAFGTPVPSYVLQERGLSFRRRV